MARKARRLALAHTKIGVDGWERGQKQRDKNVKRMEDVKEDWPIEENVEGKSRRAEGTLRHFSQKKKVERKMLRREGMWAIWIWECVAKWKNCA
jgi:hypothetical protein